VALVLVRVLNGRSLNEEVDFYPHLEAEGRLPYAKADLLSSSDGDIFTMLVEMKTPSVLSKDVRKEIKVRSDPDGDWTQGGFIWPTPDVELHAASSMLCWVCEPRFECRDENL